MKHCIATVFAATTLLMIGTSLAAAPAGKKTGTGSPGNPVLASSKRYESFEGKLRSFRSLSENATVATQTARTLFQMGKSAPPALGGLVLEASCAAFIACGADASYADARKALGNPKEFESLVLDRCQSCGGTGRSDMDCRECHGSGRCPVPSCSGGRRYVPKLGVVACPTCKGTSRCQDCRGTGKRIVRCSACGGAGRRINRDSAQTLYRERIDAAIEECRRHEVVAVTGIGGTGTTLPKATADALANAVLKVHGPEAAATQKIFGPDDKTIVKGYKIVEKRENESGLIEVRADVLVAKVLQGPALPWQGDATGRPPVRGPSDRTASGTASSASTRSDAATGERGARPAPTSGGESSRIISVDSRNMRGTDIGALNQGDTVSFRYADGEWTNWTDGAPRWSPDDPGAEGDVYRLAIIDQDNPKAVVAVVPAMTANNAFRFQAHRNGSFAVRMNEDLYEYGMEAGDDNDGFVRYEIQIVRSSGTAASSSEDLFGDDPWN